MLKRFTLKHFSFRKVTTSLVVIASLLVAQMPFADTAMASGAKEEKKKRPTQLVGPSIGKKVQKAFEFYAAEEPDLDSALEILLDANPKKDYDKAYVSYFIAQMYAMKGDEVPNAIKYLKLAIAPDILNAPDHGGGLKLLADLQMQIKDYKGAVICMNPLNGEILAMVSLPDFNLNKRQDIKDAAGL